MARESAATRTQSRPRPVVDKDGNSRAIRAALDAGGRVVIPAEFREALGMKPGEPVLIRLLDGEVRVYTFEHMTRRLQEWAKKLAPPDRILSEELIAERRAEAARE